MTHLDHTFAVILAGGGGTRLWPKSRLKAPKQFLKLTSDKTMLQLTASRVVNIIPWERIIVVSNAAHINEVREQLPEIPKNNIIAEPEKKDTALAMLVGALYAKILDPKAIIVNQASDHVVTDQSEYIRVMKAAAKVAQDNEYLVTVGITPTHPSTGMGYIKIGDDLQKLEKGLSLFKVVSFTEKPNVATARAFISTGKYFWNANMYVWSASAIEKAFQEHMPTMYQHAQKLGTLPAAKFQLALADIYKKIEPISIDYAISEKAKNLTLIPGDFGWNDVGDWKIVYELGNKDLAGNVVISEQKVLPTLTIGAQNNLIHANGRLVALVGVNDMIVIDTDEILMIVPMNQSQDVKKLVERLKEEKKLEYT